MISTGSPGIRWISEKTSVATASVVGTASSSRRRTTPVNGSPSRRRLQPVAPDELRQELARDAEVAGGGGEIAGAGGERRFDQAAPEDLFFDPGYLGVTRTGVVVVQVFLNQGRTVEVKKALYATVTDHLAAAGVPRGNVLVNLVEVARENWSFGDGAMSYPPPAETG